METDHHPLTHMATLKDSHGRLARWALALQPYDFTVIHRSGHANANTDGLSKNQGSLFKGVGMSEKAPPLGENKDTVARNVVGKSALTCTQTRIKDIPMLINAQGEVNAIREQKKLLEELVSSANWLAVGWLDVTVT